MNKLLNNIRKYFEINKFKYPKDVTYADISISGNSLSLKTAEGIPSAIKIDYNGSCEIIMNVPKGVKAISSNRTILINNPFGLKLNEILFYYDGVFNIEHSIIISFSGFQISGNINDLSKIKDVNQSNLSVDLDDEIIYQPTEKKKKKLNKFGVQQVKYPKFDKNKQLYGKRELTNLQANIIDMAINYKTQPIINRKETKTDIEKPIINEPITPANEIQEETTLIKPDEIKIRRDELSEIKKEKKY